MLASETFDFEVLLTLVEADVVCHISNVKQLYFSKQ